MRQTRHLVMGTILAAATACASSETTRPPVTNYPAIAGTWKQENDRPGAYRIINIFNQDTIVGGVGTYRDFNGSPCNLTVSGFLRGTQVALDLAQDNGIVYHLRVTLVAPDTMRGWLSAGSDSSAATFRYLPIG